MDNTSYLGFIGKIRAWVGEGAKDMTDNQVISEYHKAYPEDTLKGISNLKGLTTNTASYILRGLNPETSAKFGDEDLVKNYLTDNPNAVSKMNPDSIKTLFSYQGPVNVRHFQRQEEAKVAGEAVKGVAEFALPAVGDIAGTVAGGAVGAPLGPAGIAAGAVAGGAVGAGLGSMAASAISGEEFMSKEMQDKAAENALISGAFGTVGAAFKPAIAIVKGVTKKVSPYISKITPEILDNMYKSGMKAIPEINDAVVKRMQELGVTGAIDNVNDAFRKSVSLIRANPKQVEDSFSTIEKAIANDLDEYTKLDPELRTLSVELGKYPKISVLTDPNAKTIDKQTAVLKLEGKSVNAKDVEGKALVDLYPGIAEKAAKLWDTNVTKQLELSAKLKDLFAKEGDSLQKYLIENLNKADESLQFLDYDYIKLKQAIADENLGDAQNIWERLSKKSSVKRVFENPLLNLTNTKFTEKNPSLETIKNAIKPTEDLVNNNSISDILDMLTGVKPSEAAMTNKDIGGMLVKNYAAASKVNPEAIINAFEYLKNTIPEGTRASSQVSGILADLKALDIERKHLESIQKVAAIDSEKAKSAIIRSPTIMKRFKVDELKKEFVENSEVKRLYDILKNENRFSINLPKSHTDLTPSNVSDILTDLEYLKQSGKSLSPEYVAAIDNAKQNSMLILKEIQKDKTLKNIHDVNKIFRDTTINALLEADPAKKLDLYSAVGAAAGVSIPTFLYGGAMGTLAGLGISRGAASVVNTPAVKRKMFNLALRVAGSDTKAMANYVKNADVLTLLYANYPEDEANKMSDKILGITK